MIQIDSPGRDSFNPEGLKVKAQQEFQQQSVFFAKWKKKKKLLSLLKPSVTKAKL